MVRRRYERVHPVFGACVRDVCPMFEIDLARTGAPVDFPQQVSVCRAAHVRFRMRMFGDDLSVSDEVVCIDRLVEMLNHGRQEKGRYTLVTCYPIRFWRWESRSS